MELKEIGKAAVAARYKIENLNTNEKNNALIKVAEALVENSSDIISANEIDMENGRNGGMTAAILDRLKLDESRIRNMAEGLKKVALLEDPVGEVMDMSKRPNGMVIGKRRVPLGVVGII